MLVLLVSLLCFPLLCSWSRRTARRLDHASDHHLAARVSLPAASRCCCSVVTVSSSSEKLARIDSFSVRSRRECCCFRQLEELPHRRTNGSGGGTVWARVQHERVTTQQQCRRQGSRGEAALASIRSIGLTATSEISQLVRGQGVSR